MSASVFVECALSNVICKGKIVSGTQKVVVQTIRLRLIKSGLVKHHARDGDQDAIIEIRLTS